MEPDRIVDCLCGARVRMPEQPGVASLRCPVCKANLTNAVEAPFVSRQPLTSGELQSMSSGEAGATCPICQSTISAGEMAMRCSACDQVYHGECWAEIGGCGTYGCVQAPKLEKAAGPLPTRAWGDSKACPVCGETIKAIAIRCRFCETDFHTADPMERADLIQMSGVAVQQRHLRTSTLVLFVFSLLGVTAPITGLIGSAYLMPKRDQLRKCGALYLVLAWMVFIFSGLFTVLIAVFLLFEWA